MTDNNGMTPTFQIDDTEFFKQVAELLAAARKYAKKQLDSTIVTTYFEVGRMIVEREQQGQKRAKYGAKLIKGLSEYLTEQCGRGFSVANLRNFRQFYQVYSSQIHQLPISESPKGQTLSDLSEKHQLLISVFVDGEKKGQSLTAQFILDWTQYQIMMRIENSDARRFYEIESASQQWTVKQLQRQVGSRQFTL